MDEERRCKSTLDTGHWSSGGEELRGWWCGFGEIVGHSSSRALEVLPTNDDPVSIVDVRGSQEQRISTLLRHGRTHLSRVENFFHSWKPSLRHQQCTVLDNDNSCCAYFVCIRAHSLPLTSRVLQPQTSIPRD